MSFTKYRPISSGRRGLTNCITISSTQIYFGKQRLPYDRVQIEYDKEITAIRFTKGDESNGFRVLTNKQGATYINALSFINADLLPTGRYKKIAELTYRQI